MMQFFSKKYLSKNLELCVTSSNFVPTNSQHNGLQFQNDVNTHIVQFGNLIKDSGNESRRIFDFLHIRNGNPFQPRRTHEIGFSLEEQEKILQIVRKQMEALSLHGITCLA